MLKQKHDINSRIEFRERYIQKQVSTDGCKRHQTNNPRCWLSHCRYGGYRVLTSQSTQKSEYSVLYTIPSYPCQLFLIYVEPSGNIIMRGDISSNSLFFNFVYLNCLNLVVGVHLINGTKYWKLQLIISNTVNNAFVLHFVFFCLLFLDNILYF